MSEGGDPQGSTSHEVHEAAVYEAVKVHMRARGIDPLGEGVQQALVPDEQRWMRAAIAAYNAALTETGEQTGSIRPSTSPVGAPPAWKPR